MHLWISLQKAFFSMSFSIISKKKWHIWIELATYFCLVWKIWQFLLVTHEVFVIERHRGLGYHLESWVLIWCFDISYSSITSNVIFKLRHSCLTDTKMFVMILYHRASERLKLLKLIESMYENCKPMLLRPIQIGPLFLVHALNPFTILIYFLISDSQICKIEWKSPIPFWACFLQFCYYLDESDQSK